MNQSTQPLDMARTFLEEAVLASRSQPQDPLGSASCGLGDGPALALGFNEKQRGLLQGLGKHILPENAATVPRTVDAWVKMQDGLDRRRNHFMKAFRQQHGMSRKAYSPEVNAEFSAGLDAINADNDERLSAAAQELLALLG